MNKVKIYSHSQITCINPMFSLKQVSLWLIPFSVYSLTTFHYYLTVWHIYPFQTKTNGTEYSNCHPDYSDSLQSWHRHTTYSHSHSNIQTKPHSFSGTQTSPILTQTHRLLPFSLRHTDYSNAHSSHTVYSHSHSHTGYSNSYKDYSHFYTDYSHAHTDISNSHSRHILLPFSLRHTDNTFAHSDIQTTPIAYAYSRH